MRRFSPRLSYRPFVLAPSLDVRVLAYTIALTLIAGANDELMFSEKYEETVRRSPAANIDVRILDNTNHMDVVSTAAAVSVISEDIATR